MPHLSSAAKSKNKNRDNRGSRSRNTTPSSVLSAGPPAAVPVTTPFLELDTIKLLVAPQPQYGEILDRLETKPANLEPKHLEDIIIQLKQLSDTAEKRVESCEKAIRLIHDQLKELELESQHKEREQQDQARRAKAKREDTASQKNVKAKKRKDRPGSSEHVEIKREGKHDYIFRASRKRDALVYCIWKVPSAQNLDAFRAKQHSWLPGQHQTFQTA